MTDKDTAALQKLHNSTSNLLKDVLPPNLNSTLFRDWLADRFTDTAADNLLRRDFPTRLELFNSTTGPSSTSLPSIPLDKAGGWLIRKVEQGIHTLKEKNAEQSSDNPTGTSNPTK
jgi:hypothetical protein